ncbi:MAG TPA: DUF502 domain-containing protein [Thermohalobaculum sp.]|nr:DUF502 domain-containing protein [Thermohalobaculum sp.]
MATPPKLGDPPGRGGARAARGKRPKPGPLQYARANFLTGLIVVVPIVLTIWLTWAFITFVDAKIVPWVPRAYNPSTYIEADLPGFGLLVFIVFTTLIGYFAKRVFGMQLIRIGESILGRMPVVRSIYNALKQILETVLSQSATSFRQACLVEYPRRDMWAIAFIATDARGEVYNKTGEEMYSIFLPSTPNPTTGFLMFVPKKDVILLEMSIEEAAKLIISAGLVVPPTAEERARTLRQTEDRKRAIARAAGAKNGVPKL